MKGTGRIVLLCAILCAAVVIGIRVGAVGLSVADILAAFAGRADRATESIVLGLRTPRVVLAALCGAALALSGGTCQALLRNPLADPYILGISSGAAVGAVGAVMLGVDNGPTWRLPAAAFATPSTFAVGGRQYIVIACGGGKLGTKRGDSYVAFALP